MGGTWTEEDIASRLGISTAAFPADVPVGARQIARLRAEGLTRIEVEGLNPEPRFDFANRAQILEICAACRQQGVRIVSVHAPGAAYESENAAERADAVRQGIEAVRVAAEMAAEVVVFHLRPGEPAHRSADEILASLDGLPLRLTLENMGGRVAAYLAFVDSIGSPRLGLTLDVGHAKDADGLNPFLMAGRAGARTLECGGRLFHTHLHDEHVIDHVPPFQGNMQWGEILDGLRAIGYAGTFLLEASPRKERAPAAGTPEAGLRAMLAGCAPEALAEALRGSPEDLRPSAPGMPKEPRLSDAELCAAIGGCRPRNAMEVRQAILRILRQRPKSAVRNVIGASTDELLAAAHRFPQEFVARYG